MSSKELENKLFKSVYSKLSFVMNNELALKLTYEFINDEMKSTEKKMLKDILGVIGYKKIKKLRTKLYEKDDEKDDEKLMLIESKKFTKFIPNKRVSKISNNKDDLYNKAVKAQQLHQLPTGNFKKRSGYHYERDF